jgi:hypothetical protein
MKPQWIVILLLLTTTASWAADTTPADSKATDTSSTVAKPAPKKAPGTMEKAGTSVKSSYHKTVNTMKKRGKRAPCTKAAKSMGQCHTT